MISVPNFVEAAFRRSAPLPDDEEIWQWAAREVDFGNAESFRGKFDVMNVPWTKEIYRSFRDPYVRQITAIMPPQESGKTKAAEVCMAWRIIKQPAKMSFNTTTNVKADAWSETRWEELPTAIPKLKTRFSENRHMKKRKRVKFRDGTFLLIQGAELPANRQSDSVEVQVNDECMLWERPWLEEMEARMRAYREVRKQLNISLGGDKGSELDERWLEGNQLEWCHICPACHRPFQYAFYSKSPKCNVRFDLNKVVAHEDGRLDLREFEKTIYTHCTHEHCCERLNYDSELWASLNARGVYVPNNPDADPQKVSMHVSSLAIGRRPWVEILKPWVRLNLKGGIFNREILRTFITNELCEMWEDRPIVVHADVKLGSYTRMDVAKPPVVIDGKCVSGWADEWIRLMACDNQQGAQGDVKHRWFVCRAFAKDGRSRLVDCGRIDLWESVEDRRKELGVPEWSANRPGPWTVVDRRHDPIDVDEVCSRYKWFGLMGADRAGFTHGNTSDNQGKEMAFSEEQFVDVGFGTKDQGRKHAIYYYWASQRVQDFLAILRGGKGEKWELPADLGTFCPEYAEHINSHRQKIEEGKKGEEKRVWYKIGGWADHLYDCESMIVVLGLKAGVFRMPTEETKTSQP